MMANFFTTRLRRFAMIGALLALAACSSDDLPYVERPAGDIYAIGLREFNEGNYRQAAAWFNEVERQHPYSEWATRSQLMAAYAFYEGLRYEDAISQLDRFIAVHPGNPNIAYAYYLKGVSYYEQISDVRRDQTATAQALASLSEVVRRFPGTAYARDAQLKIDLTRDHLAGQSMEIGRFYLFRGIYPAAIGRFQEVVNNYQTTTHTPEALHRLTEAYLALGLREEAGRTAALLGYNFPDSDWYQDTFALMNAEGETIGGENRGWFARAFDSIF
jgi:outer membrane protein assembly factor BamD